MENKHFRPAGDLGEDKISLIYPTERIGNSPEFKKIERMDDHFRPAGDLTDGLNTESKHFRPVGDLGEDKISLIAPTERIGNSSEFKKIERMDEHFRPAGEFDDINNEKTRKINNNEEKINKLNNNINKINDYLLTVVSGRKYDSVSELGVLMGAGKMIVGLKQLMQMVDEGYNIVSAKVINADADMIEVEFQRYVYDEEKIERWRRF